MVPAQSLFENPEIGNTELGSSENQQPAGEIVGTQPAGRDAGAPGIAVRLPSDASRQ